MQNFLTKWNFKEDEYYKVIDGVVYYNTIHNHRVNEDMKKTTRKINDYRIVAWNVECAWPHTIYFLITKDKIYRTEISHICSGSLKEMVEDLKNISREKGD